MRHLVLLALVGCSSPAPAPTTTPTPPAPPTSDGLGEKCGDADACAAGQMCIHYFGIAGPRGPEFTSCEISCKDGLACPVGTGCVTVADGPGPVCRRS